MLHFTKTAPTATSTISTPVSTSYLEPPITTCLVSRPQRHTVLLATMLLKARASDGSYHTLRALIDSGSEASFVTTRCADKLSLHRRRYTSQVLSLDQRLILFTELLRSLYLPFPQVNQL